MVAAIVALGGFLMGFDASVISGVVGFIETEFALTRIQLGWSVASLTLTATLAMMVAGPISDRVGRRPVGAALIIAPMYIAEIAPAATRGRMVSFNQLNIVLGISVAFFSNYLILRLGQSGAEWAETLHLGEWAWRWMLGVEAVPACLYFLALLFVPESPRWLAMHGRRDEALQIFEKVGDSASAATNLAEVERSLADAAGAETASVSDLFKPAMRLVLTIGISVAILQQITGINSVFFYAPMIFEQSGVGTDASFLQAVLVGIVNLVFTVAAMALIDKLGRRPLLGVGLSGIAVCMFLLSFGFGSANYALSGDAIAALPAGIDSVSLEPAILGFVASFAISLGPVMWVLFSELFPNQLRGLAISFAGLINSGVSFGVQLLFPWELENLGSSVTFMIYGGFALAGLFLVLRILPETKGRSLEELEDDLVRKRQ
jgi:sugar porter (SP) family MFS transporter